MRVMEDDLRTLKQLILDKTEGTPFFMEEVVRTLVEEGTLAGERGDYRLTQHTPTLHLPPTVQGVLAARIDRLVRGRKGTFTAPRCDWPRVSVEPCPAGRLPTRRRAVSRALLPPAQRVSLRTTRLS